jgi:hypothetical protein
MNQSSVFRIIGVNQDYGDVLHCPTCNEQCLHHGNVEVFSRLPDDLETLVTVVDGDGARVSIVSSDKCLNPSRRRHGLRIHFICEHCHGGKVLEIAQHKGSTLVNWRI